MNFENVNRIVGIQNRFICSVETECEKKNKALKDRLDSCRSIEQAEQIILNEVKFVGSVLEEIRRSNKQMEKELGTSYAKLIGLGTPYEEAIHALRKVKSELDIYLKLIRERMLEQMKDRMRTQKKDKWKYERR